MKTYALDSNIVSYGLKGMYGIRKKLMSVCKSGDSIVVPPITYYEIWMPTQQSAFMRIADFRFFAGIFEQNKQYGFTLTL